jgi:hypothetical protein
MRKKAMKYVSQVTELSTEKVELARKPASILKDSRAIDKRLMKSSATIDRVYLEYVKARQNFMQDLDSYSSDIDRLINDSAEVSKALIDLGLRPNDVPEVLEANKSNAKLSQIIDDYKKLYPKI